MEPIKFLDIDCIDLAAVLFDQKEKGLPNYYELISKRTTVPFTDAYHFGRILILKLIEDGFIERDVKRCISAVPNDSLPLRLRYVSNPKTIRHLADTRLENGFNDKNDPYNVSLNIALKYTTAAKFTIPKDNTTVPISKVEELFGLYIDKNPKCVNFIANSWNGEKGIRQSAINSLIERINAISIKPINSTTLNELIEECKQYKSYNYKLVIADALALTDRFNENNANELQ